MSDFNSKSVVLFKNLERNLACNGLSVSSKRYTEMPDGITGPYVEVYQIFVSRNGMLMNRFDFWCGEEGYPDSVAIYGSGLMSHYEDIRRSMNCFGFKVTSVELDTNFVDVYFDVDYLKNI